MKRKRCDTPFFLHSTFILLVTLLLLSLFNNAYALSAQEAPPLATKADFEPNRSLLFTKASGSLIDAQGNTFLVSDLANTPLILFFWSSWCEDCHVMMSELQAIQTTTEQNGGKLLLVCRLGAQGETIQSAQTYLQNNHLSIESLYDPDSVFYTSLGLHFVPSIVVFNQNATILAMKSGVLSTAEITSYLDYASGKAQDQTLDFILRELWLLGGISARYNAMENGTIAPDDFYLSETQGLVLEYAALANDQVLFDEVLHFTNGQMTVNGLTTWLLENGEPSAVNATLDDLRIVRSLFLAQDRFGNYLPHIDMRKEALYAKTVTNGGLIDYVDLYQDFQSNTLTLCYADFYTLDRLARLDGRWTEVSQNAKQIVEGGYISDTFPLYYPRYDYDLGSYTGNELHTAEALVTIYHLAEAGMAQATTLDYLQTLIDQGHVYARYDIHGNVVMGYEYESTAIYALIARIGLLTNRNDLSLGALRLMEQYRQQTATNLNGSYGSIGEIYTFDTLQALLTLQSLDSDDIY